MKNMEANIQNSDLLRQVVEIKINQAKKERYPTAEDIITSFQPASSEASYSPRT